MKRIVTCCVAVACIGLVAGLALQVHATRAATDLHAAALKTNEAPPGFMARHVSVYHAFTQTMTVMVKGPAGSVSTTCLVTGTSARTGWVEGMIESFDVRTGLSRLRVCGLLLKSPAVASTAYADQSGDVASHIKMGLETNLSAHVGQASAAGQSKHGYEIVFRKGSAVIELDYSTYSGKPISAAAFIKLATTISSRIH